MQSQSLSLNALVAPDRRLPFGGTVPSRFGRELAASGARESVDVRTEERAPEPRPPGTEPSLRTTEAPAETTVTPTPRKVPR